MEWLGRLFGAVPKEERDGIRLDTARSYWEVDGPRTFPELFRALYGWLPEDAVLYFEGGSPDAQINDFITAHSVPARVHVAVGTIWPRPKVFHVPATATALSELATIMEHHAEPELAIHFHVYRDNSVLLEWDDAFDGPMLVSGAVPMEQVDVLAGKLGTGFRRIAAQGTPAEG